MRAGFPQNLAEVLSLKFRHVSSKRRSVSETGQIFWPLPSHPQTPLTMRENVLLAPTQQIEPGTGGQELEAGPCQIGATGAYQHDVELVAQLMQMQHVGRRIGDLGL